MCLLFHMAKMIIERIVNATRESFIWTIVKTSNPHKPQSSLPQVRCARGANTFSSHNYSLTLESLTRPIQPSFSINPEPNN